MRILRKDLRLNPTTEPPGCLVRDEQSGEEFQFGPAEQFLIEGVRQPYDLETLCVDCNAALDGSYTPQDMADFIAMLDAWGLLTDAEARPPDSPPDTPALQQDTAYLSRPNRWHLFNPERLLDILNHVVSPLRFLVWLIPLFFGLSVMNLMKHYSAFMLDLKLAASAYGILGRLLLATFTLNLVTQFVRGLVARFYGLGAPSFGIMLMAGLLPRFNIKLDQDFHLPRRNQLLSSITPSLVRATFFNTGVLMWSMFRTTAPTLSLSGIMIAFISVLGLLLSINPLWPGDGVRFFSILIGMPNLRSRAQKSLWQYIITPPKVIARHTRYRLPLAVFGLFSTAFFTAFIVFIAFRIFTRLEVAHRGAGVSVFLLLSFYASYSFLRIAKANKGLGATPVHPPDKTMKPHLSTPQHISDKKPRRGVLRRIGRYAILILLLASLFLPYRYEMGGETEMLPQARVNLASELAGIVEEVFFQGGELVTEGTPIARLSDHKQRKDLQTTESAIEVKSHELRILETTPSAEQIELAKQEIRTANLKLKYSEEELKRLTPLFASGRLSEQDFAKAKESVDLNRELLNQAQANLRAIEAQVNPYQKEALRAELAKLEHEAAYYREQLNRTALIAPITGRIVTENLHYLKNSYIQSGHTLAEIEDTKTLWGHIAVPETDIEHLHIGARVRFRLWAYPDREFIGEVKAIQPAVADEGQGRFVTVIAHIDNPDDVLLSGLTGYAKIEGDVMPVLLAFSRAWIRFFRVEIWSWVP